MAEDSGTEMPTRDVLTEILKNQMLIIEQNTKILKEKESDAQNSKKKVEVPGEIRDAVHKAYRELTDDDEAGDENSTKPWNFSKTRRDVENVKTTLAVMRMVKGWHSDAPKGSITAAVQRYYTSLYEAELRKKKKTDEKHRGNQRKYERRKRKLVARRRTMEQTSGMTSAEKIRHKQVMDIAYMSSDHSYSDEDHGSVFVSTKLAWRSDFVDRLFGALDKKQQSSLSKRSKRMERNRYLDEDKISDRKPPPNAPNWAINPEYRKRSESNQ